MEKKQYHCPESVRECILDWEEPLCESTGALPPLEESGDMEDLGWN
ncbi:MAG: hypothetical protein IKX37_05280 [Bacteroidales bacterium]|nr:hypothetical protein [Bacteroidales bacterium]